MCRCVEFLACGEWVKPGACAVRVEMFVDIV